MPPNRGTKRTANGAAATTTTTNGDKSLALPDRQTWPGWVEMESEPAFFSVMLQEMGARGIKVQELYGTEPEDLIPLPRPIHALIFLFRYKTEDRDEVDTTINTDHVWFANQIPDFACASVALLNIINNIPGLDMGKELNDFKDFTEDMNPMARGDAIDNFEFVRRIHNSFARTTDLLQADVHTKGKFDKYKKSVSAAKAREAKRARQAAKPPAKAKAAKAAKAGATAVRSSGRSRKATPDLSDAELSTTTSDWRSRRQTRRLPEDSDDEFSPTAKRKGKNNPVKDEDDELDTNGADAADEKVQPRRSGRARRPPKEAVAAAKAARETDYEAEEGYHFIAYMPIGDHVWKLDGLDGQPHDLGSFGLGGNGADGGSGDWMHVATPAIQQRMMDFAGESVAFNLMAVVRDPAVKEHQELVQNVKAIQAYDKKLDKVSEGWREFEGAETRKDVVTGITPEFGIAQLDIEQASLPPEVEDNVTAHDHVTDLIKLRAKVIAQQTFLRANLRDASWQSKDDQDKARHRRHDYNSFVTGWLGALAEKEVLADLLES
ncbi:Ubiquitin carboxyl-terminal hydrolase isozyme L5 [Fulvia fulva]|uniref:Ubiquitin carboxyl-terminal hydrolase n=1 Tax=Passalora fulva TaxID=5499 RepID=A0A9Q8PKC0_PASFU|nr:Ubiquitin carboxyl-terminal hydrolase isozyme L5 [Fulvia fulva]KAK4612144.1 Ubiquitin carboxyl-terminal hydrolase isozyme L5 [Fulvia fulva]KAK4612852.1 Ubiquitin carboxyl-terminal hydrolase isozyme L5 [Fulvia fulva]UJO24002.1 Ubiquitin carboxyl-terminal hydrolase isozyme L5 [Fulvia fulva]WPV21103.1 Ubiquitin carboxyl-terminal hydrolase isozyme L5 [Fulvia fulva]WPV36579.1 Ubiquitin carboxyl-terminal hydrolase isozyme L5 [Fulvia fulva]